MSFLAAWSRKRGCGSDQWRCCSLDVEALHCSSLQSRFRSVRMKGCRRTRGWLGRYTKHSGARCTEFCTFCLGLKVEIAIFSCKALRLRGNRWKHFKWLSKAKGDLTQIIWKRCELENFQGQGANSSGSEGRMKGFSKLWLNCADLKSLLRWSGGKFCWTSFSGLIQSAL